MSLGVKSHKGKIGELLLYIATRVDGVSLRKLLKLVYLIDEEAVREKFAPITWLEYRAWNLVVVDKIRPYRVSVY